MTSSTTRLRQVAALSLLLTAGFACRARTSADPESMNLTVRNSSSFQVNVYAVPSAPSARIRLGSVAPLTTGQLDLSQSALAAGNVLRVMVEPIGSTAEWISPTVTITSDTHPCLRVMANADGSLGQSTLTTSVGGSSSCP